MSSNYNPTNIVVGRIIFFCIHQSNSRIIHKIGAEVLKIEKGITTCQVLDPPRMITFNLATGHNTKGNAFGWLETQ
ncbi:hypothetical protein COV24_00500 [candidate division WWE3 bacterium CG10_big_fil_rev_8_21_14_0_10_32_10]|uniref:Uncharacterized protein n=1 Tax=candidate division WWE3 bacterium CG10_big_fil_rev_8_21_14_0_10_32_10 TaxID=1975090 RepID=A0A2H0RBE6_UNCKA|nr:MAG: hypothetical protein COV24_00500 [candidate division WWE3 bacterium CG10_big_fil_rev_8_21_14_0_10_32_10]